MKLPAERNYFLADTWALTKILRNGWLWPENVLTGDKYEGQANSEELQVVQAVEKSVPG